MITGGPGPAACERVSCSRTRVSLVRASGLLSPRQDTESKGSLGTQADALCSGRQARRRGTALHDKYMAGFGFHSLISKITPFVPNSVPSKFCSYLLLALHLSMGFTSLFHQGNFLFINQYMFIIDILAKTFTKSYITRYITHVVGLYLLFITQSFILIISFHNPHYLLVPQCTFTNCLTNKGRYFSFALFQFLHYPHHYIQSLSVSHPSPKSHSLRQGGSCEGDLSELNNTLHPTNYLSDCSQVSLHCCAFRLDLSIRPLFCRTFIIFT